MKAPLALAAAQTVPRPGDVGANLEVHVRLARMAAAVGARVVVFPELSLTGYELELAEHLAFAEDDERLRPLTELASALRITLVVGAPLRLGESLHIGAFIVSPRGTVVYTKRHLGAFGPEVNPGGPVPPAEATVFRPGNQDPLVALGGHHAAVAVCADTGQATHPAAAAKRGADVYLASMFFTPPEFAGECKKLRGYAQSHGMHVAMANYGGPTGGLPAAGGSAIWTAGGKPVGQLPGTGPGIVAAIETDGGWQAVVRNA